MFQCRGLCILENQFLRAMTGEAGGRFRRIRWTSRDGMAGMATAAETASEPLPSMAGIIFEQGDSGQRLNDLLQLLSTVSTFSESIYCYSRTGSSYMRYFEYFSSKKVLVTITSYQ